MRRLALSLLFLSTGTVRPGLAQACPSGTVALVLSGGGAKGLAHIGVLRVLDSLGIEPALVVGTSMGAIIGGMYASGYSGREIDSLTRSLQLTRLFRKYAPRAPRALGELQPLIVWEQGERGFILQRAAVREAEVNGLLNAAMLRGNLLARGDFDSLPIRFRATATDLSGRQLVVLEGGDLAQAIRASISIPLVLEPERIGGRYLGDGALAANIPIALARREGARTVIVSDATEHLADSANLSSPIVLADQLLGFLFSQPLDSLGTGDLLIRPDVGGFQGLDFAREKVSDLIQRGYDAATRALAPSACPTRPPITSAPPAFVLGRLNFNGGRPADHSFLRRQLALTAGDTVSIPELRIHLRRLGQTGQYQSLWLTPTGRRDSLVMTVAVRPAPRRLAGLGLTYDNDLGGRMWIGAVDRNLLAASVEGSAAVRLGEREQELAVGVRTAALGSNPITPTASLRLARETVRQFASDGTELRGLRTRELVGFLGAERSIGERGLAAVGVESRFWHEPGAGDQSALGGVVRMSTSARSIDPGLRLDAAWTTAYSRVALDGDVQFAVGRARIRPGFRFGWGKDLPLQQTFALGGDDGFAGLHIGESRGQREALARVVFSYPLVGPLQARAELMTGRTAVSGPTVPGGRWHFGARIGVGAETPIGPIRIEYGRTSDDRDAMFVRIGQWF